MTTVPMYLLELSPSDKKGIFGVMFTVGLNFGLLFSQLLGLESILGSLNVFTTNSIIIKYYNIYR
jgi:hypothetical protein